VGAKEFLQSAGAEVELHELAERGLAGAVRDVNLEIRTGEVCLCGCLSRLGKSWYSPSQPIVPAQEHARRHHEAGYIGTGRQLHRNYLRIGQLPCPSMKQANPKLSATAE
jgi:hypothetical protein